MGKLRKSSFLKIYKKKEGYLVLCLLSRKLFLLNSSWKNLLEDSSKNNFLAREYISSGLLTKSVTYKEEVAEYFNRKTKTNEQELLIYFTITSKCDLKCSYCFENHLKRKDASISTIRLFTKLLENSLKNNQKIKRVKVTLFGGEPLLRVDRCLLLLSMVKNVCSKQDISCKFSMVSNGILFKKKEIYDLRRLGLTDMQITFDGWKNSHDEIRKSNKIGYEDLLKNVSWLGKSFNLILKYNIRKLNVDDFDNFIKDIKDLKLKNVIVKLEALQSTLTSKDDSFYFSSLDPKLAEIYFNLTKIVIANDLEVDITSAIKPPCMVSMQNSLMIEPDGDISACVSAYKISKLFLGNLKKIKDLQLVLPCKKGKIKIKNYILEAMKKKCLPEKCSYFPICETGCLFAKETLKMDYDVPYCRKQYFDKLIPGLIELKTLFE